MRPTSSADAPYAALGVLSGNLLIDISAESRLAIRQSWMRFANVQSVILTRFVLPCAGLGSDDVIAIEESVYGDIYCTTHPRCSEGRCTPMLVLYLAWLAHASATYPTAQYICKINDDVFLHTPDIEMVLRSIPHEQVGNVFLGTFSYAVAHGQEDKSQMILRRLSRLPSLASSRHLLGRCNISRTSPGAWCAGPFPYSTGPFTALGFRVARALGTSESAQIEAHRLLLHQPQALSRLSASEDAWLGSAVWRHVGRTLAVELRSLPRSAKAWFIDAHDFQASSHAAAFRMNINYLK